MVVNVELTGLTEHAFLEVCRRRGQTPEEVFEKAARMTIHNYLSELTELAMPGGRERRERRRELFAKFAQGAGASTWPLTEDDAPGTLEEAEDAAREHGREQAEKFEHAMKCARHSKARR